MRSIKRLKKTLKIQIIMKKSEFRKRLIELLEVIAYGDQISKSIPGGGIPPPDDDDEDDGNG